MKKMLSFMLIAVMTLSLIGLAGCDSSHQKVKSPTSSIQSSQPQITDNTVADEALKEKITTECLGVASLYKDLYANAEKNTSEYFTDQTIISQEVIDEIETLLIQKGYSVMNSDSKYPTYLENSDCMYTFWELVSENKDAEQKIITVSETGGLFYSCLQYSNGEKSSIVVTTEWDENNSSSVSYAEKTNVLDWDLTNKGNFYYQNYPSDMHYDDYTLIRLRPVNRDLHDLNAQYIIPVEYQSNNLFLCNWSSSDYGDLCFNDLLEFLYKVKNGNYFQSDDYQNNSEQYYYTSISGSVFENTILPFFDVSLQEFRQKALYDSENKIYPWQAIGCANIIYFPAVVPEVVEYKNNDNGTFTLTVNAMCADYKQDCLFSHEVTVRNLPDGGFQYISNKITSSNDETFPDYFPRIAEQRTVE